MTDRVPAFWDTSALVPLFVGQTSTPHAKQIFENYSIVIWWAAPVEIAGALARLLRMKKINSQEYSESRKLAGEMSSLWSTIRPSDSLRTRATRVVEHYDLRAADALQLAAALEWCGDQPQGRMFLTVDRRLRQAATLTGFDASLL